VDLIRFTLLTLAFLMPAIAQATETRIALVIGNSDYATGPLANPVNDAKLIGATLTSLGFKVLEFHDADQIKMKRAIQDFGARLDSAGPDAVGLFYYAGHGVQLNGHNYLIPTKANIEREGDVEIEAVSADWVLAQMHYNRLNIMVLDACRNNPFTRSMRSVTHGLAPMEAPAGTLIAYSTGPGDVAADGNGRNSPYSEALAQLMRTNAEPLEQVFKHVRKDVMNATGDKQVPWELSSLTGDFYFLPPRGDSPRSEAAAETKIVPTPARVPALSKSEPSLFGMWISNWLSFGSWISSWFSSMKPPPGTATAVASLTNPNSTLAAGSMVPGTRAVSLLKALGIRANDIDAEHNYPQPTIRRLIESAPRKVTLGSTVEQIHSAFALCRRYSPDCQASDYADEGLRTVTLKPFELDPVPVSVGAFRQFADAAHYMTQAERDKQAYAWVDGKGTPVRGANWKTPIKDHPVEDDSPVMTVTFKDAQAYCAYKSSRLPSEDEWEYVARGPQRSVFPWGNDHTDPIARALSIPPHVSDGPAEGIGGRYKGLSGNVWQWVDAKVDRATVDDLVRDHGPDWANPKVLKGGSWLEPNPANKRAAVRRYEVPNRALEDNGFRCAKTVAAWPDADVWLSQIR
jgi:formylglycine-generating enzyme required for sulfatase activity